MRRADLIQKEKDPRSPTGQAISMWIADEALTGSCYDPIMPQYGENRDSQRAIWRALIEIAFIVFLFYSNLLMGEFTVANGRGKSFAAALSDIFTTTNFFIAITSALIGYLVFEFLRKKL